MSCLLTSHSLSRTAVGRNRSPKAHAAAFATAAASVTLSHVAKIFFRRGSCRDPCRTEGEREREPHKEKLLCSPHRRQASGFQVLTKRACSASAPLQQQLLLMLCCVQSKNTRPRRKKHSKKTSSSQQPTFFGLFLSAGKRSWRRSLLSHQSFVGGYLWRMWSPQVRGAYACGCAGVMPESIYPPPPPIPSPLFSVTSQCRQTGLDRLIDRMDRAGCGSAAEARFHVFWGACARRRLGTAAPHLSCRRLSVWTRSLPGCRGSRMRSNLHSSVRPSLPKPTAHTRRSAQGSSESQKHIIATITITSLPRP